MNEVEVHLREAQHRRILLKGITDFHNTQKRHFLTAYLFFWCHSSGRVPPVPGWFPDFQQNPPFEITPAEVSNPDIKRQFLRTRIAKFAASKPMDPLLLDLLTFLAPGRFGLFLTSVGCSDLIVNLQAWDQSVSTAVMRSFFLSPEFVTFSAAVFRPIISKVAVLGKAADPARLRKRIIDRWTLNIDRFPAAVRILFAARDSKRPELFSPVRLLSTCFFEIALTRGYERVYGLVEPWMSIPDGLRAVLRDLLTAEGASSILATLAAAVRVEVAQETIVSKEDTDELPSLFEPFLCTDLDVSLSAGLKAEKFADVKGYSVRRIWENVRQDGSEISEVGKTMSANDKAACLRHLLQRADPIPRFNTIPPDMTVDSFFRRYVVACGPLWTAYERAVNYYLLIDQVPVLTVDAIFQPLKRATFERKKEIRTLSRFARISRIYNWIIKESGVGRVIVEKALAWEIIERVCLKFGRKPKQDYFARPELLVEDHNRLLRLVLEAVAKKLSSPSIPELVLGFLSAELLFDSFREFRQDLKELDRFVQGLIVDNLAQHINKQFMACADRAANPEQQKQAEWLLNTVTQIETVPEGKKLIQRIKAGFAEQNPFRMLVEIAEALRILKDYFPRIAPPGVKLGSGQYHFVNLSLIFTTKPGHLVSTFVFLHDFCPKREPFIETPYRQVMPIMEFVLSELLTSGSGQPVDLRAMCKLAE